MRWIVTKNNTNYRQVVFQIRDAVNHIAEVLRNINPANNAPANNAPANNAPANNAPANNLRIVQIDNWEEAVLEGLMEIDNSGIGGG